MSAAEVYLWPFFIGGPADEEPLGGLIAPPPPYLYVPGVRTPVYTDSVDPDDFLLPTQDDTYVKRALIVVRNTRVEAYVHANKEPAAAAEDLVRLMARRSACRDIPPTDDAP